MDRERELKRLRAEAFKVNNGRVLATINLLRDKFNKLLLVERGVVEDGITRQDFIDCINFLSEEGYIELRHIETGQTARLCDNDYAALEAKVSAKGIRLLGGGISDNMVVT